MKIYSYSFDLHNEGTEHGAVTETELAQLLSDYATGRQRPYVDHNGNRSVPALPPALANAIAKGDSSAILEAFGEWYSEPPLHGDYAVPHCDDQLQWHEVPGLTAIQPRREHTAAWTPEFTMHVPVLSTGHITASDAEQLDHDNDANACGISTLSGGAGWLLWIGDDASPETLGDEWREYSQPFRDLLAFVIRAGFQHVRLDADGETLGHFPTFDW